MKNSKWTLLCRGAVIAALYVLLTFLSAVFGLSSGAIQLRVSEALCILPIFMPEAVAGLTLGCFIANLFTPGSIFADAVFGAVATLIGACGTYLLRDKKVLAFVPPILSNVIIVLLILRFAYGVTGAYWYLVVTVGMGEVLSVGVLGTILYRALLNNKNILK